ncbi:hypothetical protein VNO77_31850 [Canavalia gladiata]|uniref:WAT1-related protein n=1 Tax=Canavalia gladiata TaxID=3824 RepID=A0AAN9KTC7_CANGL
MEDTEGAKRWFTSSQVVLSIILVQVFATGMQILSKLVLVQDSFAFALVTYRHIVAAICVASFALYFERWGAKKMNWKVWFWLFCNALAGVIMDLGLLYYVIGDTSAIYSINLLKLIPICTVFTCILFRMENLRLQTFASKAKYIGVVLCGVGALVISLYQGKKFYVGHHTQTVVAAHETHMLRGALLLVCSSFSFPVWYIFQVKLLKVFPLGYWGTMLACVMATVQSAIIGILIDSSKAVWTFEWNLQLITIVYSGALATAATFSMLSWGITTKGPTYPPMFTPLALVCVAFSEAILLWKPLSVGTFLGMVLIIVGLYFFCWVKGRRQKQISLVPERKHTHKTQGTPESDVETAKGSTSIDDELTGTQSTATEIPSSSPPNNLLIEIDKN